ncbi:MAG: glycosyltransferase [Candidatus Phosphoribacter sp.]
MSVLMPALNEERHVADAVRSVLAQRDVDVEVLVVDGRSVDRTRAVLEGLLASDSRVRLLDNPSSTIPAGLNVGLSAARGEFVARVDCHASVSDDYLARAVAHLRRDDRLAGVGGIRTGVSDNPRGRAVALALSSRFGVGNSVNHYGTTYQLTDHASFGVYRTAVVRDVGGWDESLPVNEDVDFDHRVLAQSHALGFDPEMHIRWRVRENPAALLRQYRRYGRGKAAMVRKNGLSAVRLRHLAAPGAVVATTGLLALSARYPAALLGLAPYAAGVAIASRTAWVARPPDQEVAAVDVPLAFVAMHGGWGVGFLEGLLLRKGPALASGSATVLPEPRVGHRSHSGLSRPDAAGADPRHGENSVREGPSCHVRG